MLNENAPNIVAARHSASKPAIGFFERYLNRPGNRGGWLV